MILFLHEVKLTIPFNILDFDPERGAAPAAARSCNIVSKVLTASLSIPSAALVLLALALNRCLRSQTIRSFQN